MEGRERVGMRKKEMREGGRAGEMEWRRDREMNKGGGKGGKERGREGSRERMGEGQRKK